MARVPVLRWIMVGALLAWPTSGARAQPAIRAVAISPFAGLEFRGGQNPLFGLGAVVALRSEVALIAAVSTVRYTGVYQVEAGVRWPTLHDGPVTPYLGAGVCLLRWPSADVVGAASWRAGGMAVGGLDLRALGAVLFAEGLGVTDGTWALQVRAGLRFGVP